MIVRLITRRDLLPVLPRSLSLNREYRVLSVSADSYRLLSGDGPHDGPYLYDPFFFKVIDAGEPEDWRETFGEGGERYAQPAEFGPYTWEEYFDNRPEARELVGKYLERVAPCFWEVSPAPALPFGPEKRIGLLERLRLLARPADQSVLGGFLEPRHLTESVLTTLVDIMPSDLRSDAEREAVQRVAQFADQVWYEVIGDGLAPPIQEFVKTPASARLATAAEEALRVFIPAGYLRYLDRPSDATALPPTPDDLARARALPTTACPRRFCWWWHSLTFDWKMSVAEGCTWLESEMAIETNDFTPCSRCETSAPRDHYEPREPHLMQDGFGQDHFG